MSAQNNELKNCPFCGGHNIKKILTLGLRWLVGCEDCGCRTAEYSFSVDAVSSWDRRAECTCKHEANDDGEIKHVQTVIGMMGLPNGSSKDFDPLDFDHIDETPF